MSTKKTSLEKTVDKVVKAVLKGGEKIDIITQLSFLQEHITFHNYTPEEIAEYFPMFSNFTCQEMRKIRKDVWQRLLEVLYNPENTYFATFRIVCAGSVLEMPEYPNKNNKKIKFCKRYWKLTCSECKKMQEYFKHIKLLDQQ